MDLENRLTKLERSNRRLQGVIAGLGVMFLVSLLFGLLFSPMGKSINAHSSNGKTITPPNGSEMPSSSASVKDQVKLGERQAAGNIELEFKPDYGGVRLNGNGYIEVFGNLDKINKYPAEIRLYKQPENAPTIKLNGQKGTITAKNVQSGDLIFQKGDTPLWRMYEEESGLYVESLKTKKHYQFTLKPVE